MLVDVRGSVLEEFGVAESTGAPPLGSSTLSMLSCCRLFDICVHVHLSHNLLLSAVSYNELGGEGHLGAMKRALQSSQ